MLSYGLIIGFAAVFYRIGENEYCNKGWLLALLSVIFSVLVAQAGILGTLGANLLLFLICWIYNVASKRPPTSGGL